MVHRSLLVLCPVLLVIFGLQGILAGGSFSIKLISFRNPNGKDAQGKCCDGGVFGNCRGKCDHFFKICIDDVHGPADDYTSCSIGSFRTDPIQEENENTFGEMIGSTPSSRSFHFSSWPGQVMLKVEVYDEDPLNNHDLVERLLANVTNSPDSSRATASATSHSIVQRTSLTFQVSVYCDANYYGPHCDVMCIPHNGANGESAYDCHEDGSKLCSPGWTGQNCEVDIYECHSSPCSAVGGRCVDHTNGFSCVCHKGFTGTHCELNIDECANHSCLNGGNCTDLVNGYNCTCPDGFSGRFCERVTGSCSSDPCGPGTCSELEDSYACHCPRSSTGLHCETDLFACESAPCKNNGTCSPDGTDAYTCQCEDGWVGDDCTDNYNDCGNITCENNMECVDMVAGYECVCPTDGGCGATKENTDICKTKPCMNEGQCIIGSDSYLCRCPDHFKGRHCEYLAASCDRNPCNNNGTCGTAPGGSICICPTSYTGVTCGIKAKDKALEIGKTGGPLVHEVHPCDNSPCENNATCMKKESEFSCFCPLGFTGKTCSLSLAECAIDFCNGSGVCVSIGGQQSCTCHHGHTGERCESEIPNPCLSNPCLHEGRCETHGNVYMCHCTAGFTGLTCESDINECQHVKCKNGGTCENIVGSFYCACSEDFTGNLCESALIYNDTDAIMKSNKIQSGLIYLKGTLGQSDVDKIHVLIREVLNNHLDTTHIRIYEQIHFCESLKDGKPVSKYSFKLAIHGKPVNIQILRYTVDQITTEGYRARLPAPVTSRSECERLPESRASSDKASGWKNRYWIYVLVMGVVAAVALVVVVLIVRDRRRHKWHPYASSVTFSRLDDGVPSGEPEELAILQSARKTSESKDYNVLVDLNNEEPKHRAGTPRNFRLSSNYN